MNGGKTPASMPIPSGIEVAKVRTASPGGNVDEHAVYVRSEWHKFQQMGAPLQAFAARVVPLLRSVLDVGCGAGQELLPYLDTVSVGIDVRRSGLVEGRSLFGSRAPSLLVGVGEALPFARAAFDVVLCRLAVPYMNVRMAINEMARVLAPGGVLVLQVHHLRYYLRRLLRAHTLKEIVPDCLHNAAFAFCHYTLVNKPDFHSYVLVALGRGEPIPVRLTRIDRKDRK